jgi:hypothetical protein
MPASTVISGRLRFALAIGFFIVSALAMTRSVPAAVPAGAAPAARVAFLDARSAQIEAENKRLADEIALLRKYAPREKTWWQDNRDIIVSSVVALIIGLAAGPWIAARYTRAQTKATLTMDMIKQWLDVSNDANEKGMDALRLNGLNIDQANLRAIVKLGNLYEVMATSSLAGSVDAATFELYGITRVTCRFRQRIETAIASVSATPTAHETEVHDILGRKLKTWDKIEQLCAAKGPLP